METSFDRLLDTSGLKCPLPVIRARKLIRTLPFGTRLKIVCTDPLAEIDIPHMANSDGHRLIKKGREGEQLWYLLELAS
ncbi:sulfurtransferase TusA family protein [Aureimonas leprariae]|uniref:Sulfurtransferase TusA family protein n=1 Tax=Plantimonas leprariae TaxID=2615207 RepID=A0A7V7TYU2_9HYPH|nr:sulfurtransferase TusA family protein [Aureimonas leprariae]KAB0677973.1 sulfurtransferase TusA family protein [Aureimonas leprariae]